MKSTIEPFLKPVVARYPQYSRGSLYDECIAKLCLAVAEEGRLGAWEPVLDSVEGVDTVPILTIHKSKGLEYEAVFFVGLEDGAFWNFRRVPDEEMNAFYVAVSRAVNRVVFTFSRVRTVGKRTTNQSTEQIRKIYELLSMAGVRVEQL